MKFKFLRDIPQIQHYKDGVIDFDPRTDKVTQDTYSLCIGHGCLIPLQIGVDVIEVHEDSEKCNCFSTSHCGEGNYYLVRFDCPIHKGILK
jgi:hypothetical protein